MPERIINNFDIIKGVGELIVDEAKLFIKGVFRMPHQFASHGQHTFPEGHPEHPQYVEPANPIHLNRYEDEAYQASLWDDGIDPPEAA